MGNNKFDAHAIIVDATPPERSVKIGNQDLVVDKDELASNAHMYLAITSEARYVEFQCRSLAGAWGAVKASFQRPIGQKPTDQVAGSE